MNRASNNIRIQNNNSGNDFTTQMNKALLMFENVNNRDQRMQEAYNSRTDKITDNDTIILGQPKPIQ